MATVCAMSSSVVAMGVGAQVFVFAIDDHSLVGVLDLDGIVRPGNGQEGGPLR